MSVPGSDVAFSPRSHYVGFVGSTALVVRLAPAPLETFRLSGAGLLFRAPSFSPDETAIAFSQPQVFAGGYIGSSIRTYRVPEGPLLANLPSALQGDNRGDIRDIYWMPGGEAWLSLVTGSLAHGPEIRKFSTVSGETVLKSQPLSDAGRRLSVSSASNRIVSAGGSGLIYVWNLNDLSLDRVLTNQTGFMAFAAITEDGTTIYSGAEDDTLRSYSTSDWKQQRRVKAQQGGVRELAVDRDRTLVLTRGYDGTVRGWRADDLSSLFAVQVGETIPKGFSESDPYRVQISPDGAYFATASPYGDGRLFTIPLRVTAEHREGQSMMLEWCGGRPPFRLQQRNSVATADWEDVAGVLESRRLVIPLAGSRFYRIVEHLATPVR